MSGKYLYLDAEFNGTSEKILNVLCFCTTDGNTKRRFWLEDGSSLKAFKDHLEEYKDHVFVSYSVEAEASSLISLGIDPLQFKWIDLWIEWKQLINHNPRFAFGNHYIEGKIVNLVQGVNKKAKSSFATCLYKLTGIKIDVNYKNEIRDFIISKPKDITEVQKTEIMDYCETDIIHLPALLSKFQEAWRTELREIPNLNEVLFSRGRYSALTAKMVRRGYPVNVEWLNNLSNNAPMVLWECQKEINTLFPSITPFRLNKDGTYSMNTKNIKAWIKTLPFASSWEKTETGDLSLSLDSFTEFFNFNHSYPKDNFGAQMVRFLKLKQSFSGFITKDDSSKKTFFDYLGSDGFVRPFMNQFEAQSSRSQPSSTSFLFLKPAWQRVLCQPPKGYSCGAIDWASQEFWLSALDSQDLNMMEAYLGGDVYLYFGKGFGLIPKDGTKKTHGFERDLCKGTVLGLSYSMTEYGLAIKLTNDTGKTVTEAEALKYVEAFNKLFLTHYNHKERNIDAYYDRGYLYLPDHWKVFGGNWNRRSIGNVRIQGLGAAIMRKAVDEAEKEGIKIMFTLHDALYILSPDDRIESDMIKLKKIMKEATGYYFKDPATKVLAKRIRVEGKMWGEKFTGQDTEILLENDFPCSISQYHVDKRSKEEYDSFKKYFHLNRTTELL